MALKQPTSLLDRASHVLGTVIGEMALCVTKEMNSNTGSINEGNVDLEININKLAQFYDDTIPKNLHNVVTYHTLKYIAENISETTQYSYKGFNLVLRSHITKFAFSDWPLGMYDVLYMNLPKLKHLKLLSTFPVTSYYLDDQPLSGPGSGEILTAKVNNSMVVETILYIDREKPDGSILVFLPGKAEINEIRRLLTHPENSQIKVLCLHASLNKEDQNLIFKNYEGKRKVILTTNVAETSITIHDVKYVVDTGLHKEKRLNITTGISSITTSWISQSSVNQRKGRAGRVCAGEAYHLYSKQHFQDFELFPTPEVLRVPLEKIVLDLKTFFPNEKAEDFLKEMLDPPTHDAIQQAVMSLTEMGALTDDEKLTVLGWQLSSLSCEPKLSKALILSKIFKCAIPIANISSILETDIGLFNSKKDERKDNKSIKQSFVLDSGHLAMSAIFNEWLALYNQKSNTNIFITDNNLRKDRLHAVRKTRQNLLQAINSEDEPYNINSEIIKGVLLKAWDSLLIDRNWRSDSGSAYFTLKGHPTVIATGSVNYRHNNYNSPFLIYYNIIECTRTNKMVTWDTSEISPLTVLLFKEQKEEITIRYKCDSINGSDSPYTILGFQDCNIWFTCLQSQVTYLIQARNIIQNLSQYFIVNDELSGDVDVDDSSHFKLPSIML